jgi:hypothetical protein
MRRVRPVALSGERVVVEYDQTARDRWIDLSDAVSCKVEFWPSFRPLGQPDVLLIFRDASQKVVHLVVVEAKLHSPKSGEADESEDGDADHTDLDEPIDQPAREPDQLARYWRGALDLWSGQSESRCSVVYLTAHSVPPVDGLAASLTACRTMRLAWMSWRDIWHVVVPLTHHPAPSLAAMDIQRLLANRGFKSLDAFKDTPPMIPTSGRFWQHRPWFNQIAPLPPLAASHFWEAK